VVPGYGGKTEEKIGEQVEQQTGTAVSLAGMYVSGGNIALIVNNAGGSAVNITGYKIVTGGSTTTNTSAKTTLSARSTGTHQTVDASCTTGDSVKIQLFMGGVSTQEYIETCP
jgi:hypothetical protein